MLRPVRGTMPLRKEGIWVFRAGEPLSAWVTNQVLEDLRAVPDRKNMGKRR